jgi:hypothetical protein
VNIKYTEVRIVVEIFIVIRDNFEMYE